MKTLSNDDEERAIVSSIEIAEVPVEYTLRQITSATGYIVTNLLKAHILPLTPSLHEWSSNRRLVIHQILRSHRASPSFKLSRFDRLVGVG